MMILEGLVLLGVTRVPMANDIVDHEPPDSNAQWGLTRLSASTLLNTDTLSYTKTIPECLSLLGVSGEGLRGVKPTPELLLSIECPKYCTRLNSFQDSKFFVATCINGRNWLCSCNLQHVNGPNGYY